MVSGVLQTHVVRVADKRLAAAEVEIEVDQSAREDVEISCGDVAHAVCAVETPGWCFVAFRHYSSSSAGRCLGRRASFRRPSSSLLGSRLGEGLSCCLAH